MAPSAASGVCALAWFILGATLVRVGHASDLEPRATTTPAPIVFAPDQNWDGIDGEWSAFTLRVGTPQQFVRVLPATASQQTWAIRPEGCAYTSQDNYGSCAESRGLVFNMSASSTWDFIGNFSTAVERSLGFNPGASYGYDTVGLGGLGNEGPTISNTTVAAVMDLTFFNGMFGLHPKPTNFTSFNDPAPSYMSKLKDQDYIPSLSYGYTAGNQYRLNKVLGSLTLGGYDSSKFTPNNLTFPFAPDNERDVVVGLQGITMSDATNGSADLLPEPVTMYIDSTVSQIWLPVAACAKFEDAFGLVYNEDTDLYLVNDTLHDDLLAMDANVTFTLGQTTSGGETIDIVLPYAAFDLTAQPPYQGLADSAAYFPLRRGQNETQYVFGRTLLQEAYIIVDHERGNFSVSQCVFESGSQQTIVPILSTGSANKTADPSGTSSLGTSAVVGIAVGMAVAVLAAVLLAGLLYWRRRYRRLKAELASARTVSPSTGDASSEGPAGEHEETAQAELDGTSSKGSGQSDGRKQGLRASEADAEEQQIFEMAGDMPSTVEADGRQLSEKQAMVYRERKYNGMEAGAAAPTAARARAVTADEVRVMAVSPLTETGRAERSLPPLSPLSPLSGSRRRFSFEE